MRTSRHRSRIAVTAACAAVAAALSGPAGAAGPDAAPPGAAATGTTVTLVTGDRVVVRDGGGAGRLIRAEGREDVPFRVFEDDGATYTIPADALPMIAAGTLDRRLFDVTELSRAPYQEADGLPLIVTYTDERPAALRAADVRADLPAIDGEALTVEPGDATALWEQLTGPRTLASGVETVALDGVATKTLAESVPQIGAPEAWAAGYDGEGVTVAVLDTGISSTHPDVADHVVAAENFSDAADAEDRDGHGTHVASTATGTGAHSGGTYTGVAPGADLINAKVLDDTGSGWESDIVEGMQWAVDEGADIVSLSLGGTATPEVDPLEEAVESLSASSDALFVIAAGNEGPGAGTVGSPGTAASALTVGAVDKQDVLASFSSTGPTPGEGLVKPDVTAPGVDIAAAGAEGAAIWDYGTPVTDGYVAISGTSMATPHVSGAAALLAQAHPDWTGQQIKAALTSSAVSTGAYTPFQQGTGRIDVPAALAQHVIAETGPLSFGVVPYPHDTAEPVTRDLTYRNLGDTDTTLDLTTEATGPDGNPAPDGLFTLAQDSVTVPAGGTATVQVTADTSTGDAYGAHSLTVTATGDDGTAVTTVGAVEREEEKFDLAFTPTGRDGAPAADWTGMVYDLSAGAFHNVTPGPDGTATLRLPAGSYAVDTSIPYLPDGAAEPTGWDWLLHPVLDLTEDTTVAAAAADARPIDVTGPDAATEQTDLTVGIDLLSPEGAGFGTTWVAAGLPDGLRTAALGDVPDGWTGTAYAGATWEREGARYHLAESRPGTLYTGLTHRAGADELARIATSAGASLPERTGSLFAASEVVPWSSARGEPLPVTTDVLVEAGSGAWSQDLWQDAPDGTPETLHTTGFVPYEAGGSYETVLNVGVFGPRIGADQGLFRSGDTLFAVLPLFADGAGNSGDSAYVSAATTLSRDGEEYAASTDPLGAAQFALPAEEAAYELVATVDRTGLAASVSTRVTVSYAFTSAAVADGGTVALPASAVRFTPELALDSTGPAGETVRVPVAVEGAATGTTPAVEVSYDGGATWAAAPVEDGAVTVENPAADGTVSFRATATDTAGNTTTQTITDAYRTR
ncbi:S8 family serine peptidase [Streptomyces sp. NPDC049881]|uniref:S8 family serine peptidase n=1 Tax=Streptomyces sp. NPDC049881 TaxID=3155778 RepID=UPI00343575F8